MTRRATGGSRRDILARAVDDNSRLYIIGPVKSQLFRHLRCGYRSAGRFIRRRLLQLFLCPSAQLQPLVRVADQIHSHFIDDVIDPPFQFVHCQLAHPPRHSCRCAGSRLQFHHCALARFLLLVRVAHYPAKCFGNRFPEQRQQLRQRQVARLLRRGCGWRGHRIPPASACCRQFITRLPCRR